MIMTPRSSKSIPLVIMTELGAVVLQRQGSRWTFETSNGVRFHRDDLDAAINTSDCNPDCPWGLSREATALIMEMVMTPVEGASCMPHCIDIVYRFERIDEMRDWCRDNAGLCTIAPTVIWERSGWWWVYRAFFANREDAAMFRISWC